MIKLLHHETYKLFKIKKTYFSLLGMSIITIIFFLTFIFLYFFKSSTLEGALGIITIFNQKAKIVIISSYFVMLSYFSLSSLVFMSLLIGELISNEFGKKTIKILFLQPYSRAKIYIAKFLTLFSFHSLVFISNILLYYICYWLLDVKYGNISNLINMKDIGLLTLIFFLINISYLFFIFLLATIFPSTELTMGASVFLYFILRLIDAISLANSKLHFLPDWFSLIGKYSFTAVLQGIDSRKLYAYLMGKSSSFSINHTYIYLDIGYLIIFFLLGLWIFSKKEV